MTEDSRISEIRAEVSAPYWADFDNPHVQQLLDSIRAILDRPAPAAQPVDWPAVAEAFADEIAELSPPAPRVFLPGDVVPAGIDVQSADRNVYRWATVRQLLPYEGPMVEVPYPSPEEWQAVVDRARDERADAEWQHTEGTNP